MQPVKNPSDFRLRSRLQLVGELWRVDPFAIRQVSSCRVHDYSGSIDLPPVCQTRLSPLGFADVRSPLSAWLPAALITPTTGSSALQQGIAVQVGCQLLRPGSC